MKKLILLLTLLLGLGVAFFAAKRLTPEPSPGHPLNARSCSLFCCLPDDIQMSASQKEAMHAMAREYCRCRDAFSAQIDQKRLTLADMLLRPQPDPSSIDILLRDIAKLQTELEKKTIIHILDIKNRLAPEQQEQFIKPIVDEIRRRCQHRGPSGILQEQEGSS